MPHRPVYRDDKDTTKMRIVFDTSSSENNNTASLNDHLDSGINLLTDLTAILIRIRCQKIAIVPDIKKAFLQIAINEAYRDELYKSAKMLMQKASFNLCKWNSNDFKIREVFAEANRAKGAWSEVKHYNR